MSVSHIGATPVQPPAKAPTPRVADDQSQFKAGLARQAAAAEKSAVEVARPASASVHLRA